MATALSPSNSIVLTAEETASFGALQIPDGADIAIHGPDGDEVDLPKDVQKTVLAALQSIIENGEVAIMRMPAELTSTSAAEILGVSRPTLMKWAKEGKVDSFKVGTHTRFNRGDILALRRALVKEQDDALEKLRSFELQEFGPVDD
ncbi:DNA binding domain-containing protein, excisionase family [Corynebacterium coyleae]|uniref:Helix-turn-helix domain-containing protein n=1 Tax=Corynebacterium coyleae TaxID=53374 RepID=A0ABX8KWJ4_9CORY|nr:helix-turn-helix domain-containing protein [Corynebacterium coyleae]MDK6493960.1 helix-turn-helix domain-containing protein [Corynebacterium coyleae]PLA27441.1 DNA-binding protein [Corynebacterium coyleae]QXB19101.1 helix-turn-helix domain-containing protein [Corynebacterium coyleae]WJY80688.1 Helix-turn-helix domain protein [Corynebacterium coyleae]SEB28548.1 DNA binding domain-containing protein, excisionase family [Corynebacterium coyleae]